MAQWVHKIELKDLSEKYDKKELTANEVGIKVAERIRACSAYNNPVPGVNADQKKVLEPIAKKFEKVKTEAGFNKALESLYDWGDTPLDSNWAGRKMCWIGFAF